MSEQNHKHRLAINGGDGARPTPLTRTITRDDRPMNGGPPWNTFVMVAHLKAFLEIIFRTFPALHQTLFSVREVLGSVKEEQPVERRYCSIVSAHFSTVVLAQRPGDLSVLKVNNVGWTDLGESRRAVSELRSKQFLSLYGGSECVNRNLIYIL